MRLTRLRLPRPGRPVTYAASLSYSRSGVISKVLDSHVDQVARRRLRPRDLSNIGTAFVLSRYLVVLAML